MDYQAEYQPLFDAIPDSLPADLTFMEIAGYSHYENVCSNILKFYINPKTKTHDLSDLLLTSLLQTAGCNKHPFVDWEELIVKREMTTKTGRIDLVLFTDKWVIGIENKIRHHLNNDLEEYSTFLAHRFNGHEAIKIVLSLKDETENLKGGFINITYQKLIKNIEANLREYSGNRNNPYFLFFINFIQTIKNLYIPINMEREEIEFIKNNQQKISELIQIEQKLNSYIDQRANSIINAIPIGKDYKKWVYQGYDAGFHYIYGNTQYKLECRIDINGISIVICVEENKIDEEELKKLDLFKDKNLDIMAREGGNSRVILEQDIDFFIPDEELVEKLEGYLAKLKITPQNEQLN